MNMIAFSKSTESHSMQMIIGGLLLGTIGIFVFNAGQPPVTTVFFRSLFGCIALGIWMGFHRNLKELKVSPKSLLAVSVTGTLMASIWWLYFLSLNYISVGLATLVYHLQPFWLILLSAVMFRENINRSTVIVLIAALVGLTLATGVFDDLNLKTDERFLLGIGLCMVGSVLYAIATLIAKSNSQISPMSFAWWQCLVSAFVTSWSFALNASPIIETAWFWLISLGVIHSGLAFTLIYSGMSKLPTSRIAVLQFIYPGAALLVDWVYFDHSFTLTQWFGVALLVSSLWSLKRG
ncbi:hypothetical protein BA893_24215 [Vibrio natriegens]|uniref:DMT family transporter n=1 Tax=Vibrio TaxID=662 RepID=UPI000804161E|nr:DMT family transporter [Vibrio natriegens]ANQ24700.1 hypothetical protein BA893_24215 [Vibrio natriegens]